MTEQMTNSLIQRLEQVERKHRRLKWVIGVLTVALLAASTYQSYKAREAAVEIVGINLKYGLFTISPHRSVAVEGSVSVKGNRGGVWLHSGFDIPDYGPGLTAFDEKGKGNTRISLRLARTMPRVWSPMTKERPFGSCSVAFPSCGPDPDRVEVKSR
jgi:hypothetical protein